jgi:hypothetical protein
MTLRKIDRSEWHGYCDAISKLLIGKVAEVEVAALSLGDQIEVEWLPLLGITYDPKNNLIEVALDEVDHLIHDPREFYVEEGPLGIDAIEIVDGGDERQIIKLQDPLALPFSAAPRKS